MLPGDAFTGFFGDLRGSSWWERADDRRWRPPWSVRHPRAQWLLSAPQTAKLLESTILASAAQQSWPWAADSISTWRS